MAVPSVPRSPQVLDRYVVLEQIAAGGPVKPGGKRPGKKIEQEASGKCLKSEYLTLLNSFRVLQKCDYTALSPARDGFLPRQPPKSFNEKELYGR